MKTNISKFYLNMIINLGKSFALNRSQSYSLKYRTKVFNSTFNVYYNIGIFLYIRLLKITRNKINFKYNHIDSVLLKKFSCKLYKQILDDLIIHKIIIRNNHYFHHPNGFSKSFLIHKQLINKIDNSKYKLSYELESIVVPQKIIDITKYSSISGEDDFLKVRKLNRFNGWNQFETNFYYNQLKYDEKSLNEFCNNDDFLYIHFKKKLNSLQNDPKFIKGRYYHAFHEFSKDFRENVLRFEGEKLKEIFDVTACDLHMLAKLMENQKIPVKELKRFQKEVKSDFRKKFGVRKKDGKCTSFVKLAFKVYMNSKKSFYDNIRFGSLCWKIDQYFQMNFPTVREYLIDHDCFWQEMMNMEFATISDEMFEKLKHRKIKSFTCHDAIYVKESVDVPDINQIFYDSLNLAIDLEEKLDRL